MDWIQEESKRRNDSVNNIKEKIKQFGVTGTIKLIYSGYGDSGDLESESFDIKYKTPPQEGTDSFEKFIESECWNLLPGGWEINEGSDITITIECKKNVKIIRKMDSKFTEIHTETDTL